MKELLLTFTADEPLVITDGAAESMAHQSLPYIPGNMLLGALAQAWISRHPGVCPDDDPEFCRLFLSDEVEWGHAYLLVGDTQTVPVPLCFSQIKNQSGLPVEGEKEYNGVILNNLRLAEKMKDETSLNQLLVDHGVNVPEGPVKRKKLGHGFMDPKRLCKPDLNETWAMHVALGTQRSALEGQLFGYSALARKTRFRSIVRCSEVAITPLRQLMSAVPLLHVGHARSAGYGKVAVEATWQDSQPEEQIKGTEFSIFLHSDYLPVPSWENPIQSLLRELCDITGTPPNPTPSALHIEYRNIQGYNGLWRRPRTSRMALGKGSVVQVKFEVPVSLPRFMTLGGDKREGYGRMESNAPFLKDTVLRPQPVSKTDPAENKKEKIDITSSFWKILRKRTLQRQAGEQTQEWLNREECLDFLDSVKKLSKPTQTQRGNIRRLVTERLSEEWLPAFTAMLEKTPGKQWKEAVCTNPFRDSFYSPVRDHLDEVMKRFLNPSDFEKQFSVSTLNLLGGKATDTEKKDFFTQAHRLFLLDLLYTWEKLFRTTGKEGK